MRKFTTEDVVVRAKAIHGDKYDYSKIDYVDMRTKVCVVCSKHGEFMIQPQSLLAGHGCQLCGREQSMETMLEKKGVLFSMQSKELVDKANATKLARYGQLRAPGSGRKRMTFDEFIQKAREVHGDTYDYSNVVMNGTNKKVDIICPKHGVFQQTPNKHLSGHGCNHPECVQERRAKLREAKFADDSKPSTGHHGGKPAMTTGAFVQQAVALYGDRYDYSQANVVSRKKKVLITCNVCGTTFEMSPDNHLRGHVCPGCRGHKAKSVDDGKLVAARKSRPADMSVVDRDTLYARLAKTFGPDGVSRGYFCDRYPFVCDFYVPFRDMFIECSPDDGRLRVARDAGLNYVVFWDAKLRDAMLWFASGCPDARDWEREYSWIRPRDFVLNNAKLPLNDNSQAFSRIAKRNQLHVFYKEEIGMWRENRLRDGIPLQIWLYYNRYKYVDKAPNDLSDLAVLRGFKISGLHMGHSVFDTGLMRQAVEKYDVKSIYDPCAGWGERMLFCRAHDIKYLGVDINQELSPGYKTMARDYNITEQKVVFDDSETVRLSGRYDCVFTCPPYGNQEIYSELGAENLSYCDFLAWWGRVVENALSVGPRYFMFQSNQKWLGELSSVVEGHGFRLVDRFDAQVRASHMNRGTKKEFESLVVFEKI